MQFHLSAHEASLLNTEGVLKRLQTDDRNGLDDSEVRRRLDAVGPNELGGLPPEPLYVRYLEQFKEPMILLLLLSASVSFLMGQYDDTVSITMAVLIVVTVAFIQNYRSEKALEALKMLMPPKCTCIRSGRQLVLLASELVPGDLVVLSMGDRIPADIRIIEAVGLRVDESSLTGETEAVSKLSRELSSNPNDANNHTGADRNHEHQSADFVPDGNTALEAAALDRLRGCHDLFNIGFLGTLVCCGNARGIVIATGERSEFGEVFRMMRSEEAPRTPLQKNMDRLGKQLSFISLVIIGSIVFVGLVRGHRLLELLNVGVSLAVAAIPEGLPIVVTVTLALGQMRMAARNAVVRKLPAVETLGCVNVVCADKTGTMTKNEMTISQVVSSALEHYTPAVANANETNHLSSIRSASSVTIAMDQGPHRIALHESTIYDPTLPGLNLALMDRSQSSDELPLSGTHYCPPTFQKIIEIGCICNNAVFQDGELLGQPTEGAFLRLANLLHIPDERPLYQRLQEWPFSSETKMMVVSCVRNGQTSSTPTYFVKGAVDRVLSQCVFVREPSPNLSPPNLVSPGLATFDGPESFSFASGQNHPLRPEHTELILAEAAQLGNRGLRVLAVAKGPEPERLTFYGLVGLWDPPRPGVDRCVRSLLESGVRVVMITGDSVETARAIGRFRGGHFCGANLFCASKTVDYPVRMVVNDDNYVVVRAPMALQQGGMIVAMTGDGVNDAVALKSSDIGVAMGLRGTDVCREASDIVLLDDNFATILAAMEEGKSIFHNIRNFVGFQLSTLSAALFNSIALLHCVITAESLNAMQILYINILMDGPPAQSLGVEPPDEEVSYSCSCINHIYLRTVSLSPFLTQKRSIFSLGFTTNRMFLIAVSLSLFGQFLVIYFPPLQAVFQTEALYLTDLLLLVSVSSTVFIISELRKFTYTPKWARLKAWRPAIWRSRISRTKYESMV
ncbi:Calcium-transporting ATPase type 2C member 1 [Fasciola gigantica]|uniref:P-type Ca(2+) transporter n=1 Tax=Fasciola gigantica TaxID=46835 RepID=A0A504Y7R9_FASGI|nr:Calcium-transporting ATPase type 2C member 1 [Fasciola gigantica]